MSNFGTVSYALAAGLFGILAILLLTSWRGRLQGGLLIGASLVTVIWATLIATQAKTGSVPLAGVVTAEFLRAGVWIMFLSNLASALGVSSLTRRLAHVTWAGPPVVIGEPCHPNIEIHPVTGNSHLRTERGPRWRRSR